MSAILQRFFVCTWRNLEGDTSAGTSPRVIPGGRALALPRGRAPANLQLLVLTPDARLLHLCTGGIDAIDLRWELAQALITYEAVKAKPRRAREVVVWRQNRLHDTWLGRKPRARGDRFRLRPSAREEKTAWRKPRPREQEVVAKQRRVVKRNALAPEHKLKTAVLAGTSGGGFARDGKVLRELAVGPPPTLRRPGEPTRPYPWDDMPPELRRRFAEAVGHPLPTKAAPKAKPTTPKAKPATTPAPRRARRR